MSYVDPSALREQPAAFNSDGIPSLSYSTESPLTQSTVPGEERTPSSQFGTQSGTSNLSTMKSEADKSASKAEADLNATASSAKQDVKSTASDLKSKVQDNAPTATGIRQRVNSITSQAGNTADQALHHPAVQNAKEAAQSQVGEFRKTLGRSPTVLELEKRTGVDRVVLVVGGIFAYLLLVPLNLFGLALPVTTFLTLLPPTLLAARLLDARDHGKDAISKGADDDKVKNLLSYFVVLGFIQFAESLAAGLLERRIPQYYTVKLIVLAYLLHPKTNGASKIHQSLLKPLLSRPAFAPTSEAPTTTNHSSPTFNASSSPLNGNSANSTNPFTSGSDKIHLPSGGGNGVGADVPRY